MKKIKLLVLAAMIPLAISAKDYPKTYFLEGIWKQVYGAPTMEVREVWNGLEVRFATQRHFKFYRQTRNNRFRSRSGNTIRLLSSRRMLWRSDCGTRTREFQKVRSRYRTYNRYGNSSHNRYRYRDDGQRGNRSYDDRGRDRNNNNDDRYQDRYRKYENGDRGKYEDGNRGNSRNNKNYGDSRSSYLIEGDWKDRRTGSTLTIQTTSDGIDAKSALKDDWYFYNETADPNVYQDKKGNQYLIQSEGSLMWKQADGKQTIIFEKIK